MLLAIVIVCALTENRQQEARSWFCRFTTTRCSVQSIRLQAFGIHHMIGEKTNVMYSGWLDAKVKDGEIWVYRVFYVLHGETNYEEPLRESPLGVLR